MNISSSFGVGGASSLAVLCEDGERVLCRGWRDDGRPYFPPLNTRRQVSLIGFNQAAKIATHEMLNFVVETKGLPRDDVLMLLSAAMDLHVTEIVDGTKGIHAMLPKEIFQK